MQAALAIREPKSEHYKEHVNGVALRIVNMCKFEI